MERGRVLHIQNRLALLSARDKAVFENHLENSGFDFNTDPEYKARWGC
jgi:hypothetical protein